MHLEFIADVIFFRRSAISLATTSPAKFRLGTQYDKCNKANSSHDRDTHESSFFGKRKGEDKTDQPKRHQQECPTHQSRRFENQYRAERNARCEARHCC
jgi:hypothetical protein